MFIQLLLAAMLLETFVTTYDMVQILIKLGRARNVLATRNVSLRFFCDIHGKKNRKKPRRLQGKNFILSWAVEGAFLTAVNKTKLNLKYSRIQLIH